MIQVYLVIQVALETQKRGNTAEVYIKYQPWSSTLVFQPVTINNQFRWKEGCYMHLLIRKLRIFSPYYP